MKTLQLFKARPNPDEAERMAWLRLIRTENIGPVSFYQLIDTYGSAVAALEALPQMAARAGRKKPLVIPAANVIAREVENLRKLGGDIITAIDESYPLSLSATADAPPVLSVIGKAALLRQPCVALVGARNASLNGRKFAEKLARDLGAAGQVVVSGLARGIDTSAHVGSLASGTIAVVAGGIDVVYPPENQKLYEQICAEGGLVVAESPLGQEPFAQSFPRRNRIVSGLSSGVVVVEATLKSGSLITARLAGEQGRDVYAVPGHPLDPRAAGPNHLIREGAVLVRGADDILEHTRNFSGQTKSFEDSGISRYSPQPLAEAMDAQTIDEAREMILNSLSLTPCAVDDLIRATGLSVPLTQVALLELELAGQLQRLPGNRIALI